MPPSRRIAVVAVHGVADQAAGASCRSVAGLLSRLSVESGEPCYGPFDERTLEIPVRRLPLPPDHVRRGTFFFSAAAPDAGAMDDRFLRGQIEDYEVSGGDAVYRTRRLEGRRAEGRPDRDADVHVYEMYWADLSRLGTGALRILSELYQLLLHLGSLGKHAAAGAVADNRSTTARGFKWTTAAAGWTLAVPIGLLNLYMIAVVLLPVAGMLSASLQSDAAIVLATVMTTVVAGYALMRLASVPWPVSLAVLFAVAGGAGYAAAVPQGEHARLLLGGLQILLAAALMTFFGRWYRQYRPGSRHISGAALAAITVTMAVSLVAERHSAAVLARAGFRAVEVLFVLLRLSWAAFIVFLWGAMGFGAAMYLEERRRPDMGRAVWTACLALGAAAYSIIVVAIVLWSAVWATVGSAFVPLEAYTPLPIARLWLGAATDTQHFTEAVLLASATPRFAVALVFFALAMLVAAWSLGPVVWTDVSPPADNARARRLGRWLDNAPPLAAAAGAFVLFAFAAVLPGGVIAGWLLRGNPLAAANGNIVLTLGTLVAAPAAGLLALPGRLNRLTAGFRSPLDIALDIDNYLREHPRRQTPRARQVARYWSLLTYLADREYDAIVLVAHSQGTVLTADLLRYLRRHDLGRLPPVHLFTMGCPLRQLYGDRFPHLYEWAHHESAAPAALGEPIPADQAPDPAALGVRCWVNAYRSGDFIGRWLWRTDTFVDRFEPPGLQRAPWTPNPDLTARVGSSDAAGTRREFCVGAGAHTHYWDDTAPEIAVELDALIAQAR